MIHKSKILNLKSKRGFTLIEILVVISIIGILATLILARLGGVEKAGRDARRRSDLNQYRTALENYALNNNSRYPIATIDASTFCAGVLNTYMGACPQDPRQDATYSYRYSSDGLKYILWAQVENEPSGGNIYYYICYNGKIAQQPTAPTLAGQCP
jgi:prepilin-type N-terminal cleavage/methylation domain-containing protein